LYVIESKYIQGYCWSIVSPEDVARAQMVLLLFINSDVFRLDSFSDVSL